MRNNHFTLTAVTVISILIISLVIEILPTRAYAVEEETHIPPWMKKVAKSWADNRISDSEFTQEIQYLMEKGIVKIPETQFISAYPEIPPWIKISAGLWSDGKVDQTTVVKGIQYLIQTGFVIVPQTMGVKIQTISSPPPGNAVVWFAPLPVKNGVQYIQTKDFKPVIGQNLFGSRDYMGLFTNDAPWKNAQQHVQVFKLYQPWVINATDLELKQTVTYLNNHNIAIAMESGPLESNLNCGQGVEGFAGKKPTLYALDRIKEAGGAVRFITLDEPFYFGNTYDGHNACHWSTLKVAQDVFAYVQSINLFSPGIMIGDTEPIWQGNGVIQYENWLNMYLAVSGTNFPFFVLDNDWSDSKWPMIDKELETFANVHKIQLGIIYFGNPNDITDKQWLAHAEEKMITYEDKADGRPDFVIFQSWNDHPNYVLPETSPNTFTHLILSYFKTRTLIVSSTSSVSSQINGTLMQVNGKPIADASIQLFTGFVDESGIFIESGMVPVDGTKTDKDGTFHFNSNGIKSDTTLQAEYAGNDNYWPAYSEIKVISN